MGTNTSMSAKVPTDLYLRFKRRCASDGASMNSVIVSLLRQHVEAVLPTADELDELERRADAEWSRQVVDGFKRSEEEQRTFAEETERRLKEALGDLLT